MKKSNWLILVLSVVFTLSFVACEETDDEGEYANWKERNDNYIDSIAKVAKTNADGKWKIFKSWTLPPDNDANLGTHFDVQNYVYIHIKEIGSGAISPLYTDSVSVSYREKLINGEIFAETFSTNELNPETAGRVNLELNSSSNNNVNGLTTALQYMHVGDLWDIYIPWNLAHGTAGLGSIPGYSDLIFELYLAEISSGQTD